MTAPIVSQLPPAPNKLDGIKVFNIDAKALTDALPAWTDQINALAAWMNDIAAFAEIINDSNITYELDNDDAGKYRRMTHSSTKTINVESGGGSLTNRWHFRNPGAGNLTFAEGGGVQIQPSYGGTLVVPQHGTVTLVRISSNTYELWGQTVPAA